MTDQEIPKTTDLPEGLYWSEKWQVFYTAADPYASATKYEFLGGLDIIPGVPEWRREMSDKWHQYLLDTSAITRESLQFLPEEDKAKNKPTVWATEGCIEAQSGGTVLSFLRDLEREYDIKVRSSARNARATANPPWKPGDDHQYLIDPDGNSAPPGGNGTPYGPYSMPGNQFVKGDEWTADLQPGHRYTK